jgi:type IV fimbrial biogenesis protein FimT
MLMQRSRRASGFTMIEMAITMTVFAILVALGVPSMTTWIRNNKVRTVADTLQTGLRLAQSESLRRSRHMGRLVANTSANVTNITGGDTCVQPSGTPPVQSFSITLAGADRPLQVNLSLGGQVHMCDPGVALSDIHPEGCP